MNEAVVIQKVLEVLRPELETAMSGPQGSTPKRQLKKTERKTNTHWGLEASYLAAGQANKVAELKSA